ncbi:MAG: amidohydrolase family protein [Capsulimonadaceae bacterium]
MEITDVNTVFGAYPARRADSTADALVAAMATNGVHFSLSMASRGIFYQDSAGNEETVAVCRRLHPLVPVATLDPRSFWGQPDVIRYLAAGYEMYRFFPNEQRWPVEMTPFRDILDVIEANVRKPVMISVGAPGDATRIAGVMAGYTVSTILEGVTPDTIAEAISVMKRNPSIYLETHALRVAGVLLLLRETVGIGRVLFGSFGPGLSLAAALRFVRGSGLSPADQDLVLGGNAAAIWHGEGA